MFLVYSRLSTKEGLFTDTTVKDQDIRFGKYNKDLYRECHGVINYLKLKKHLRKTNLCVMNAINSDKWKTLEG